MKHKHHIIPRHRGGSDDPSNLVEVSLTQHIMFHWCEWQRTGNEYDKIAWKALSGKTSTSEEARRQAASHYMKNRVVSNETKKKISLSKKGVPNIKKRGTQHNSKSKCKMSNAAIKNRGRKIKCIELNKVWDSPVFAAQELNIPVKQIRKCIYPGPNKTARGLTFVFE